jgi:hypothetical protein
MRCFNVQSSLIRKLSLAALFSVAGGLLAATPAQAAYVVNLTTSTDLFYADFENGTVGSAPTSGSPTPGTWSTNSGLVYDFSTTGVNAFEGVKFGGPLNDGNLTSATLASGTSAGDTIRLSFAFYFATGEGFDEHTGNVGQIRFRGSGGTDSPTNDNIFIPEFRHDGSIVSNGVALTQTFNFDAWNTFFFTYTLGSASATVSVNGGMETITNTAPGVGAIRNIHNQLTTLNFRGREFPGAFYIDAIPEPASLALIGLGGLLMLRRNRQQA